MVSSLEGYAITGVKFNGVDHEFSTIKGVMEDVVEIILNLKQVRFHRPRGRRGRIRDPDLEDRAPRGLRRLLCVQPRQALRATRRARRLTDA